MDTERERVEGVKKKMLTPEEEKLLSEIEEITKLRARELSEAHGVAHTEEVVGIAKYLAIKEKADVFKIIMAAWLHDWGRIGETERISRGLKNPHAEISRAKSQRLILQQLLAEGKITSKIYQHILTVIESHSDLPGGKMQEKKILRDADRLSRLSAIGLHHSTQVIHDDKAPFYVTGQPIIYPPGTLSLKNLKSAIDHINFAIELRSILETKTADTLADKYSLVKIHEGFLKTFAKYKDVVNQEIWEKWIASVAENSKKQRDEIKQECKSKNKEIELEEILALETPDAFSEENFRKFLKTENLNI